MRMTFQQAFKAIVVNDYRPVTDDDCIWFLSRVYPDHPLARYAVLSYKQNLDTPSYGFFNVWKAAISLDLLPDDVTNSLPMVRNANGTPAG